MGVTVSHNHAHDGHHGHAHDDDTPPSFKYSRAANVQEDEIMEEDIIDLPPKYSNEKPSKSMVSRNPPRFDWHSRSFTKNHEEASVGI